MSETQLVGRPLNGLLRAVFASPLYGASLGGGARSPIAASFEDPWPGGAEAADRLFQGRYVFTGEEHRRAGAPPWGVADASPEWTAEINSFNWLRDFRAQGGETARRAARELLRAWLVRYPGWDAMAWRPDVLGRRLAAWLCHAGFLLDGADEGFRDAFLVHFARQARHLHRAARLGPEGAGRIAAAAGLCLAGAAFPGISAWRERGLAYLGAETERQILRDGGHVTRNPSALVEVFGELVRVRAALRASRNDVPTWLQNGLDRMAPALRLFRHGDGGMALFNGAHEEAADVVDALLAAADARGRAPASLADSGFARIATHRVTLVMDAGAPPPPPFDRSVHAGPVSFEMSVGRHRLIVNCGRGRDPNWRRAGRATAAHSTLTVGDTNARPAAVGLERTGASEGHWIETSHGRLPRALRHRPPPAPLSGAHRRLAIGRRHALGRRRRPDLRRAFPPPPRGPGLAGTRRSRRVVASGAGRLAVRRRKRASRPRGKRLSRRRGGDPPHPPTGDRWQPRRPARRLSAGDFPAPTPDRGASSVWHAPFRLGAVPKSARVAYQWSRTYHAAVDA